MSSTIRTIDAALAKLERQRACTRMSRRTPISSAICVLQTERNTLIHITRLPFDILHAIAALLSAGYFARWLDMQSVFGCSAYGETDAFMPWRPLMHTCTHMRSLFISSAPGLWSYVDLNWKHQWLKTCVERAGMAHIAILASQRRRFSSWKARAGVDPVRIRQANLRWLLSRQSPDRNAVHDLHALVCLGDDGIRSGGDRSAPAVASEQTYLWTQLQGRTACATLLRVSKADFPADIGRWTSLVGLDVSHCGYDGNPRSLFRSIAQAAPQIEQLTLECVRCSPMTDEIQVVELENLLPRLQDLRIRDKTAFVATALHALVRPRARMAVLTGLALGSTSEHEYFRGPLIDRLLRLVSYNVRATPITVECAWRTEHFVHVYFDHPRSSTTPRVAFTDYCTPLPSCAALFERFGVLRVLKRAVQILFDYATRDPAMLASIEHVVIVNGEGGLPELATWLSIRAAAGRCVRSLNFEGTKEYLRLHGSIPTIVRDYLPSNLIGAVQLQDNGQPLFE
jgi:hypothetical protein